MSIVKVSPKYQIVIPKDVRSEAGIEPGQQFQVMVMNGRIRLVPVRPITELRGILKKDPMPEFIREEDDRY